MTTPLSVLLYSHDSQGLGHVRRNLALAHHIAAGVGAGGLRGLVVSGLAPSPLFTLPGGFDWLALPGVEKRDGVYVPRRLPGTLSETVALRSSILGAALDGFVPDLVIVDRHPLGIRRELEAPLRALRRSHPDARVVLGLRDVLDDPAVAAREWEGLGGADTLAPLVDQVWVYGDPRVHDATSSGEIPPALASRALFTGYLAAGRADEAAIAAEEARDLTTTGRERAAQARAAVPTPQAKAAVWRELVDNASMPNETQVKTLRGFNDVERRPELLAPFIDEYVRRILAIWETRTFHMAENLLSELWSTATVGLEGADPAGALEAWLAEHPDAPAALRRIVSENLDDTRRTALVQARQSRD